MNWKKLSVYSILVLMIVIPLMASLVLAAENLGDRISSFIDNLNEVASPIFAGLFGNATGGDTLTMQVLAFILVTLVIYGVLSGVNIFGDKPWLNLVVGIVVSIIGIRFLPQGLLESAAVPSSAFVALIVMGIPFILLFFILLKIPNTLVRRAGWAAYAAICLVLLAYNWDSEFTWVYLAIASACLLAFLFDGTLQRFMSKAKAKRTEESVSDVTRKTIIGEIRNLESGYAAATTKAERDEYIKKLKAKRQALEGI